MSTSSRQKARVVLGWALYAVLTGLNAVFCIAFWLLPATFPSGSSLPWDGWLSGIALLGLPVAVWASDRGASSPLRASVVTLVMVLLIFLPLFLLQSGIVLLGGYFSQDIPHRAISFLAWAEIAALPVIYATFRGGKIDVSTFFKGVVVVLYFTGVLILVPVTFFSYVFGSPLLLLACAALPFVWARRRLPAKCGAGLAGLLVGATLALPLALIFPFARSPHFDPTLLVFAGLTSPLGGIAGVILASYLLERKMSQAQEDGHGN